MKQAFDHKLRLNHKNKGMLRTINTIIEQYVAEGYKLTLRQLYYQLVSRDLIPNTQKEYAKLGNLLKKGRMAGVVDWDSIEDRMRIPNIPYYVDDVADAFNDAISTYRLDRMRTQDVYIEVWSEKDALSGILKRITSKYHVHLVINRGYGSATALYDAHKRFYNQIIQEKKCYLLYFGDHDSSGLDMVRDIRERLEVFLGVELEDDDVEVEDVFQVDHIGLTMAQVNQYQPPPNPAKESDPRFKWYETMYGNKSWEVDALEPKVLTALLSKAIEDLIDVDKYQDLVDQEVEDKNEIHNIISDHL